MIALLLLVSAWMPDTTQTMRQEFDTIRPASSLDLGSHAERAQHEPSQEQLDRYSRLRESVIRFQGSVRSKDVLRPWLNEEGEGFFVGSGFVVRYDDAGPLIVTNAHVVSDGQDLTIQVPAFSKATYAARAVLVNHDMDIALVVLEPDEVPKLEAKCGKLAVLELFTGPAKLGADVVAMGFPMGQESVKISKGVLSGHENVGGFMEYQQTAPISPGNSGGPLFADNTNQVIGINFAAAVGETSQHNNFAIPSWRVLQMLDQFDKTRDVDSDAAGSPAYTQAACVKQRTACEYKVPQLRAQPVPGSPALYKRYGCKAGVFLSQIANNSVLALADPPVRSSSFVVAVNGVELDPFGNAKAEAYFDDPVSFFDLMLMGTELNTATLSVCTCGEVQEHQVPLVYTKGTLQKDVVPNVDEPAYSKADFEQFGGLTVQPLTVNIIKGLVKQSQRMDMVQYVLNKPEHPLLVITDVAISPSDADPRKGVMPGDIVESVNGHKVSTLAGFRAHFAPEAKGQCGAAKHDEDEWSLETASGRDVTFGYGSALAEQRRASAAGTKPLTEAVRAALKLAPGSFSEQARAQARSALPVELRRDVRRGGAVWPALNM